MTETAPSAKCRESVRTPDGIVRSCHRVAHDFGEHFDWSRGVHGTWWTSDVVVVRSREMGDPMPEIYVAPAVAAKASAAKARKASVAARKYVVAHYPMTSSAEEIEAVAAKIMSDMHPDDRRLVVPIGWLIKVYEPTAEVTA